MQTLILPGFSKENKSWVDETVQNLKVENTIRPFYWMHWTDENSKFDAQEKADLIVKHIKEEKVKIIAKSVGTLVACKVFIKIPDRIEKIILCGIPTTVLKEEEIEFIKTICLNNKNKIKIIQNIDDPYGSYESIKEFGDVIQKEASDHNYPYYIDFNNLL